MSNITMNNGATFAEGSAILGNVIKEIVSTSDAQVGLVNEAAKYGFVMDEVTLPNAVITSMVGPEALSEIDEDGEIPLSKLLQGYEKGYQIKMWGRATKASKLFMEWLKKGESIRNAMDSSVQAEIRKLAEDVGRLIDGATMTANIQMAKIFARGGVATESYGPGSPAPDGVALFSTSHVVKKTGATFSNKMNAGATLSAANLQTALNMFKTTIKTDNGYSMRAADVYTLLIPRALEVTARGILNTTGNGAGMYAGTGSNANLLNTFNFDGNRVELVILDMLGEPDENGATIGTTTQWFLMDKAYALKYKCLRMFTLWSNEVNSYYDNKTKAYVVDLTTGLGFDHYGAHQCTVGYIGD